jgi:hypothetical protein
MNYPRNWRPTASLQAVMKKWRIKNLGFNFSKVDDSWLEPRNDDCVLSRPFLYAGACI